MPCTTPGDADPETSGIGVGSSSLGQGQRRLICGSQIVLAFALQAFLSLLLSFAAALSERQNIDQLKRKISSNSDLILVRLYNLIKAEIKEADPGNSTIQNIGRVSRGIFAHVRCSITDWPNSYYREKENVGHGTLRSKDKSVIITIKQFIDELKTSGYIDPLAADLRYLDDVLETFHRVDTTEEDISHRKNLSLTDSESRNEKKRRLICKVLLVASDAQTMTGMWRKKAIVACIHIDCPFPKGIALIISALAQSKSLSIYHFRVVYDTINFTA